MIDILRVIASRDFCKSTLGDTISVIYADESNKEEIISRINNYDDNIPMVLASQYFDTPAYEINENELAKNLTCFAYVVVADCAFMRSIKNQIQLKSYNGTVTVLTKEQIKSFRKEDMYRGVETTPLVFDYINKYSQSISLPKFVVKESTITIKPQDNKKENQEELQELKNQLEEANQKIKNLEKALEQAMDKKFGIILPKEIYDGEVLDLISCAVEDYIQNADDVQTRIKQLGKKILDLNPRGTNGKEFFEKVYSIVSKDGNLNSVQKSQLKALGFQETRKNGHHIFEIEGIPFTFSSSSSDFRNGKKINNTIKRTLCVYR